MSSKTAEQTNNKLPITAAKDLDSANKDIIILIDTFRQLTFLETTNFSFNQIPSTFLINDFLLLNLKNDYPDIYKLFKNSISLLPEPVVLKFASFGENKFFYFRNLPAVLQDSKSLIQLSKPLRSENGLVVTPNLLLKISKDINLIKLTGGISRFPTFKLEQDFKPILLSAGSFDAKELGFWVDRSVGDDSYQILNTKADFSADIYSHIIATKETLIHNFTTFPKYFKSLKYQNKFYYNLGSRTSKHSILQALLNILHSIDLSEVTKGIIILPKSLSSHYRSWVKKEFEKITSFNKAWNNFSIIFC